MDDYEGDAAEGLVWGVLLSLPFWACVAVGVWLLWRRH